MSRIRFGQVIRCAHCRRHLGSFAMRAKCVLACGAWLCRRGDCKDKHPLVCGEYESIRRDERAEPDHP